MPLIASRKEEWRKEVADVPPLESGIISVLTDTGTVLRVTLGEQLRHTAEHLRMFLCATMPP